MGKIIYHPHCEKCGALIKERIKFSRYYLSVGEHCLKEEYIQTEPERCPSCGTTFDSIEVPLPIEKPSEELRDRLLGREISR